MLDSISQIKEKVHSAVFDRDGSNAIDLDAIVADLKTKDEYKDLSEEALYAYASGIVSKQNATALKGDFERMGFDNGKPKDPMWGQYSYQEILAMVENGVMVPEEFVDWARTMQDSDTMSYQIEGSSEDPNAYENLMAQTSDLTQSALRKKAQALTSKAQAQEELINSKVEEVKPILNTVQAEKHELEQTQAATLQKLESMTNEWKALNRKFKNGVELTDAEQKKYKELGLMLNNSNNTILIQTQQVSADIEDLVSQLENIDMLLNINDKINAEIENVATQISWTEGNRKHIILPTNNGNQITGLNSALYSAAMGNNLSINTTLTGNSLMADSQEISNLQVSNVIMAEEVQEQVDVINNAAEDKDPTVEYTTNKQAETQGSDKKSENEDENAKQPENKTQTPVQGNPNKTEAQQILAPVNKQPETEEAVPQPNTTNNTANQPESPENQFDSETGNVTGFADVVEENPETETKTNTQLQTKATATLNNASAAATTTPAAVDGNATVTAAASETSASAETTDASSTTGTTETTENTQTSVETEDPAEAETSQYVSECQRRNTALTQAEQQIQAQSEEVKQIRSSRKIEEFKTKAILKKKLAEYDKLAQKVKNGETLSDTDQKRVKALEKELNADNGTIISQMKDKVTSLTGFTSQLQNSIQATKDNQEYGKEAVAKGKEYAQSVLGDRSFLSENFWFNVMSKEKQYDLLYGKAGESIGRDAIDNGELLINNSAASAERLSKSLPLAGFAMSYSNELNTQISETNQKVASIQDDFKKPEKEDKKSADGKNSADGSSSNNKTSSEKKDDEDLDESDGKNIENKGKNIKSEGNDAKKEGQEAAKDKKKADKDSKKETNELKKTAQTIKKLNAENKELNQSIETMNNEAEVLNSELESASAEQSEDDSAAVQPVALNNNNERNQSPAVTMTSTQNNASGDVAAKVERLQAISTQSTAASNKITINNKSITVMNKNSTKRVKQLQKMSEQKHKMYNAKSKKADETQNENSKFQKTVNKAAKVFTGITLTGIALMLIPWTHAIGEFMFHVGAYGTAACYTTNGAIYAANGNLKAALINFGAAGLSFVAAGGAAVTALGAVGQVAAQAGTSVAVTGAVIAATTVGAAALQKAADKPFQNADESTKKNKKERRLVSYQEKRSRQSKMDKIEHTKRVNMARGQKKR